MQKFTIYLYEIPENDWREVEIANIDVEVGCEADASRIADAISNALVGSRENFTYTYVQEKE